MKVCDKCLTPDTRPRIQFHGSTCNGCIHAHKVNHDANSIDYESRHRELEHLIHLIKQNNDGYKYHCIVPWSGGKDSSAIAIRLKEDYGLNPLLVHFNPLIPTDVGIHNRKIILEQGLDSIEIKTNLEVSRYLSKRFLIERGNPKLHWDAGVCASIYKASIAYKIPYIFYAEHAETNYGGRVLDDNSEQIRSYEECIENTIGDDPENWTEDGKIDTINLFPYIMPDPITLDSNNIEAHFFGYYTNWNVNENYRFISSKVDFRTNPRGRTYGTCTNYDSLDDHMDDLYYYMQFIKFGFGRAIRDLSRQIQNGEVTRDEALKLAKLYDGEYPEDSIEPACKFLDIDEKSLLEIIDSHRNPKVWYKEGSSWINKVHELIF